MAAKLAFWRNANAAFANACFMQNNTRRNCLVFSRELNARFVCNVSVFPTFAMPKMNLTIVMFSLQSPPPITARVRRQTTTTSSGISLR